MTLSDAGVHALLVIRPVPVTEATGPVTWSSKGLTCERSSASWVVSSDATIRPVSASTPTWSFFQDRRRLAPGFSISHSPGRQSFRTVLVEQPLPGPAEFQARAVHQQVHRLGIAVRPRPRHLQGLGSAAQGGMV